jgi:hypothetical protein
MTTQELEDRVKALEEEVTHLKDIEEIKKLQKIYGYYLERWQTDDIAELFSDTPDTSAEIGGNGVFIGKKSIRKFFARWQNPDKNFLHVMTQVNDVVDLDEGGKTAKGRWYGLGVLALPIDGVTRAIFSNGVYEDEYIKENGKWKFKKMHWYRIFFTPYEDGWVKTPVIKGKTSTTQEKPDKPTTVYKPYPSGEVTPFHFKHPITGK